MFQYSFYWPLFSILAQLSKGTERMGKNSAYVIPICKKQNVVDFRGRYNLDRHNLALRD